MDAEQAIRIVAVIGVGVFILMVVLSVTYQGTTQSAQGILSTSGFKVTQATVRSGNAVDANVLTGNTLVLSGLTSTGSGSTGWITSANPLIINVTGFLVATVASNTVFAVPAAATITQSFTINSATTPQTLNALDNFYNITKITLQAGGPTALPPSQANGLTANVVQNYLAVTHSSSPSALTSNSQTGNAVANVIVGSELGAYLNFTTNGASLPNTYGSNLTIAITALVLFVVIAIIAGLFLARKGQGVLGE